MSARLSTLSAGARRTPKRPLRPNQAAVSLRNSASGTISGSASAASSPKRRHSSADTSCRFRMRRIGALLEGLDTNPADCLNEALAINTLGTVDLDNPLDRRGDFALRHGRPDHLAEGGKAIHRATERNLVPLFTMLIHTENADVSHVVVAAGVHAT